MANEKKWQLDLGEYIRQGEPAQAEKSESWQIAIGLQQVDGLETSDYLLATAKDHIEGKIDIKEAQRRIVSYYEAADQRQYFENDTAEADIVSSRITELLGENTFQFSPVEFQNIHKRLFTGIIDHAGMWRTYKHQQGRVGAERKICCLRTMAKYSRRTGLRFRERTRFFLRQPDIGGDHSTPGFLHIRHLADPSILRGKYPHDRRLHPQIYESLRTFDR